MRRAHVSALIYSLADAVIYFCLAALFRLAGYLIERDQATFEGVLL